MLNTRPVFSRDSISSWGGEGNTLRGCSLVRMDHHRTSNNGNHSFRRLSRISCRIARSIQHNVRRMSPTGDFNMATLKHERGHEPGTATAFSPGRRPYPWSAVPTATYRSNSSSIPPPFRSTAGSEPTRSNPTCFAVRRATRCCSRRSRASSSDCSSPLTPRTSLVPCRRSRAPPRARGAGQRRSRRRPRGGGRSHRAGTPIEYARSRYV